MNEYINKHLEDVMFILLDKLSRLRSVDFKQVNNEKVASVIKKFAYDILVTYFYVYEEDIEEITACLKNDLSTGAGWSITPRRISLTTSTGIDIVMTVANEENLSGLTGELSATTLNFEIINVEEDAKNTYLSYKTDSEEITFSNGKLTIIEEEREYPIRKKVTGLNSLIIFSRERKNINEPVSIKR